MGPRSRRTAYARARQATRPAGEDPYRVGSPVDVGQIDELVHDADDAGVGGGADPDGTVVAGAGGIRNGSLPVT